MVDGRRSMFIWSREEVRPLKVVRPRLWVGLSLKVSRLTKSRDALFSPAERLVILNFTLHLVEFKWFLVMCNCQAFYLNDARVDARR